MLHPLVAMLLSGLGPLALAVALLVLGPLLWALAQRWAWLKPLLDGVVLGGIGLLAIAHILPDAVHAAGWGALGVAAAGLLVPALAERLLRNRPTSSHTHRLTFAVVLLGLGIHAALDGAALVVGGLHPGDPPAGHLAQAVLLHRVPVALALWGMLRPGRPLWVPSLALSALGAATGAGFFLAESLLPVLHGQGLALFQAFVAGSLLHVVLHRDGATDLPSRHGAHPRWTGSLETAGAALAVFLLSLPTLATNSASLNSPYAHRLLALALQSAAPLLAGYLLAGVVKEILPESAVGWLKRGRPAGQALRGMAFGIPLPICSCGIVPLYQGLVQRGVPGSGAMAFLVATPEIGVESIFLSVVLMGAPFTGVRLGAAALVAFGVGYVVGRRVRSEASPFSMAMGGAHSPPRSWSLRARRALAYGLGEVVEDTAAWIAAGLLVAAALDPAALGPWLAALPAGLDVLVFAGLGIPVYVCASAATPLAAALLWVGVSPGAALAFLLSGPATNVTTFGVLSGLHGRSVALSFAGFMLASTTLLGLGVNALLPTLAATTPPPPTDSGASWLAWGALGMLAVAFGRVLLLSGPRRFLDQVLPGITSR